MPRTSTVCAHDRRDAIADGKPTRRKEEISVLLDRVAGSGRTAEWGETKYADPRTLVLKTAERLQGQLEGTVPPRLRCRGGLGVTTGLAADRALALDPVQLPERAGMIRL